MDSSRNLTVAEVVEMTIRKLSSISVPVAFMEQIGVPIAQAVNNLKKIQEAWAKEAQAQAKEEQAEQEEEEDQVVLEILPNDEEQTETESE